MSALRTGGQADAGAIPNQELLDKAVTSGVLGPPQMKQNWNMNEKTFIATSNARNEHMLKEAGDFAHHLKHCEKDIRGLKNATEGGVPPLPSILPPLEHIQEVVLMPAKETPCVHC